MVNNGRSVILIMLLVGLAAGLLNNQFVIPVTGNPDQPVYHGVRGLNNISLTFNVDWGSEFLPVILEILEARGVKVTFFVTGAWASNNRQLIRDIVCAGHNLGNHGFQHRHPRQLSNQDLRELILDNQELLYKISGIKTALFSPPYGEIDDRICRVAAGIGYRTIMWSVDTIDWQRPEPAVIIKRVEAQIDDGGIILMHPTRPTVQALPAIIDKLRARGYNFVTITQLVKGSGNHEDKDQENG